ncbi:MAG: oxidoreductase [Candidatus Altiarchaeota archaeon]|nr:oxidoreductase [Candidatus Altiarchaeota archaeon]
MPEKKLRLAICRGATCSGCDIAVLDIHERLLSVLEKADIVFAPTIMDAKYEDLEAMEDNSIDVGLYHGSVRLSENEHMAELMRKKCRLLIAFGACACFGGIFGLANVSDREEIFREVYKKTASTENPDFVTPEEVYRDKKGHELTLPRFYDDVYALDDKVDVDYYVPLCPPVADQIMTALNAIISGDLPPKGAVIALEKTLCSECPRKKSERRKIDKIHRPHEVELDPDTCFLDQGLICMGPATRAGCGGICLTANVPCRGCNGPTKEAFDQGGNMLGLISTIFGICEEDLTEADVEKIFKQIKDPLGTFYRFTLPKSMLRRVRKGDSR